MSNDYNGWTNWETWQILLWASNDQHLYNLTTEFVEWASRFASFDYKCQKFFYDMFPNGTPDMDGVDDMMAVNWKEIAQHLEEWND